MGRRKHVQQDAVALDALVQVGATLGRVLEAATRRAGGIGLTQYHVLAALHAAHPHPLEPRQIAGVIGSGSAHVTMLLDQLVGAGLVERRAHASDRRRREVVLTPAGRDRVEVTMAAVDVTARGILARAPGLGPRDLLAVAAALDEAVGDIGGPLSAEAAATPRARAIPGGR